MSVLVENISKSYGSHQAVSDLSFSASPGSVLGFLGPNGAGKSTTMKMICSYIQADKGSIKVCDINTRDSSSLDTRSLIGYLPEHNPLYLDMYVREYLSFIANIFKIDKTSNKIEELIEKTGLTREANKIIGTLSKGYRQRVGLAQALIHDPKVLILDEPTSGLDPNQLVDIRNLIKEMGKEKTVIFSTHVMQEVQALCDRVVIIDKGVLVANDEVTTLTKEFGEEKSLQILFEKHPDIGLLRSIRGVIKVAQEEDKIIVTHHESDDLRPVIFDWAVKHQNRILMMNTEDHSIEDIFKSVTSKSAQDA